MSEASGASGACKAAEVTRIKLKISNFSGSIAPWHPISDEFKPTTSLPSRMVVYTQTSMEEKLIVAVCGHRPELTGPRTGLRSAWGTAGTSRHPDRAPGGDSEIPPAPCLQRTSWTQTRRQVDSCTAGTVHTGDVSHDQRGKRAGWEIPVQKWADKRVIFFSPWASSAISANDANSPKWSSGAILYLLLSHLVWTPLHPVSCHIFG